MDGFADNAGIIVIAATNRDDVLDPALLRAGRFDRKITVSLPDRKGREEIFKVHSRNKILASNVDFEAISKRTVGFSGADIENIMNEAAILAVRRNKEEVGIDEIDEAIDRRIAGPAKSSRALNENEKKMIAYHEAGHAIIGLFMPHSDKVQKITIIPRGNTGGHVRMTPEEDRFLLTKKELEARIVGYLGGRSSEEIFFDDISTGASNDIEVATSIARMMVTELGMSPLGPIQYERNTGSVFLGRDYTSQQKNFSTETALAIDKEIFKIIDDSHQLAKSIILEHKDDLILIANTLLEYEQITAEEIDYLLEHRHLKRDEVKEEVVTEAQPVNEVTDVVKDNNGGNE
jgi:cell division protease FtsH